MFYIFLVFYTYPVQTLLNERGARDDLTKKGEKGDERAVELRRYMYLYRVPDFCTF